jgi:hypothetical protein
VVDPSSVTVNHQEHQGTITVTTAAGCAWTAVSRDSWIKIISGASGTGDGHVRYEIERLPGGPERERSGRLTIGDETVTVLQQRGSAADGG